MRGKLCETGVGQPGIQATWSTPHASRFTVRLRWAPVVRFEALLGLFRMSRSYRPALLVGTASALYIDSVYLWAFVAFLGAALGVFRPFLYPIIRSRGLYPCL